MTQTAMKRIVATCLSLLLAVALVLPTQVQADSRTDQRLQNSQRVFESFVDLTEQSIPGWLLERAYGVVVVPNVVKAALTIGGRGGKGVMAVRNPDGAWSLATFVTLGGVNFGFQFGVQSTDVVLVLMSRESVEGIAGGKVTLVPMPASPPDRSAARRLRRRTPRSARRCCPTHATRASLLASRSTAPSLRSTEAPTNRRTGFRACSRRRSSGRKGHERSAGRAGIHRIADARDQRAGLEDRAGRTRRQPAAGRRARVRTGQDLSAGRSKSGCATA